MSSTKLGGNGGQQNNQQTGGIPGQAPQQPNNGGDSFGYGAFMPQPDVAANTKSNQFGEVFGVQSYGGGGAGVAIQLAHQLKERIKLVVSNGAVNDRMKDAVAMPLADGAISNTLNVVLVVMPVDSDYLVQSIICESGSDATAGKKLSDQYEGSHYTPLYPLGNEVTDNYVDGIRRYVANIRAVDMKQVTVINHLMVPKIASFEGDINSNNQLQHLYYTITAGFNSYIRDVRLHRGIGRETYLRADQLGAEGMQITVAPKVGRQIHRITNNYGSPIACDLHLRNVIGNPNRTDNNSISWVLHSYFKLDIAPIQQTGPNQPVAVPVMQMVSASTYNSDNIGSSFVSLDSTLYMIYAGWKATKDHQYVSIPQNAGTRGYSDKVPLSSLCGVGRFNAQHGHRFIDPASVDIDTPDGAAQVGNLARQLLAKDAIMTYIADTRGDNSANASLLVNAARGVTLDVIRLINTLDAMFGGKFRTMWEARNKPAMVAIYPDFVLLGDWVDSQNNVRDTLELNTLGMANLVGASDPSILSSYCMTLNSSCGSLDRVARNVRSANRAAVLNNVVTCSIRQVADQVVFLPAFFELFEMCMTASNFPVVVHANVGGASTFGGYAALGQYVASQSMQAAGWSQPFPGQQMPQAQMPITVPPQVRSY